MANNNKLKVVLAGRSETALKPLAQALATRAAEIACFTHLIGDGRTDTLSDLEPIPDVLVLRFDSDSLSQLAALADSNSDSRPPLIVVGPANEPEAVRLAVRSGARDFLPEPVETDELITAIERLRNEPARRATGPRRADVIVVNGAAGGVGTSLVACNLALALATETKAPTLLLDLDVAGAPLSNFLDVSPGLGLPAALAEVEYLDEQALPGYVAKHHSGLRLMGTPAKSFVSPGDLDADRFAKLLSFLSANFRYIVVDASHALDSPAAIAFGMAKRVVLVVQQSVLQLKQASRMLNAICNEIGVPSDRIVVVVNRYQKHSTVALDDIRRALGHEQLTVLPSHYKSVIASIDSGIPLLEYDHGSPVARGIIELQQEVAGGAHVEHRGLLRRALPIFSGG